MSPVNTPGGEGGRFAGHPRLDGHDPHGSPGSDGASGAGTDTAGTAWAGRLLTPSPFAGDDGAPAAQVRAAMHALATATASGPGAPGVSDGRPDAAERDLLHALASARLFAAIEAVPTQVEESGPLVREVESDMASPVLTAPDGRRAMPLFTGLDTLAAWQADARPVPVVAADAAVAALEDACDVVLLDLGSPDATVLRLSQLWALAQRRPWLPAHEDPVVQAALGLAVRGRPDIVTARLEDGTVHAPGVTRLVLELRPGLTQPQVNELTQVVGQALATDPEVRSRIDDIAMVLRSA